VHTGRWCAFNWAFPFHYAPFAADIAAHCDALDFVPPLPYEPAAAVLALHGVSAETALRAAGGPGSFRARGTPFTPLMQLMAVLPHASSHCLPPACRALMGDADSPLRAPAPDMYPAPGDLILDPNEQQRKWQWVVLLPWLDEQRLRAAFAERVAPALDAAAARRNTLGCEEMWFHASHPVAQHCLEQQAAAKAAAADADAEVGATRVDVAFADLAWAAATGVSGTLALEGVNESIPLEADLKRLCAALGLDVFDSSSTTAAPDVMRARWSMPYERPHLCAMLPGARTAVYGEEPSE
jgi:hypothetical protein